MLWIKQRSRFISICAIISLLLVYSLFQTTTDPAAKLEGTSGSKNQTLGFGAIYVLTEDTTTWRVQGLLQAAKLTELQLTVPVQRHLPHETIVAHLAGDEAKTDLNEIRALLNYIALLEMFLLDDLETALFMEDDVDFGVDIKSQMEKISQTILRYSFDSNQPNSNDFIQDVTGNRTTREPYGVDWDILWLGHFGIETSPETDAWVYNDPHALPWDHLTSEFNNYYEQAAQNPQTVLYRVAPMATYAFGITRSAAQQLVQRLRNDKSQRFDLALHIDCKGGRFLCLAPVPEVMHHHQVDGGKSLGKSDGLDDGQHDLKWWRTRHKYTYNIQWSARCNAAGVGENVGDRWQCMPGKYDPYMISNVNQIE